MLGRVLILGAGVTGLSCARKLVGHDFLILEKENEVGGYCRTIHQDGFTWDYSGHFFHFKNLGIQNEFSNLLSGSDMVYKTKKTKVYYKGSYIDAPFQYNIHQLSREDFIDCLVGLFTQEQNSHENFKAMLYSKFGEGICERFLIPYNTKLYACDLNLLDANAMGRFFPYAKPEEIVKGFVGEKKKTYNDTFFYSRKGARAFIDEINKYVDSNRLHLNSEVIKIDLEKREVHTRDEIYCYKYLINTMPLPHFMRLANIHSEYRFTSNRVLVFNLGFDRGSENDYHWAYFPDRDLIFYRVGFYNNILGEDKLSLYVEIGLDERDSLDEGYLFERTMDDLKKVGIISSHVLKSKNCVVMDPAYVHISTDSNTEKSRLKNELRNRDVFTIGRYGDWTYCSIEDCILQAYNTVEYINSIHAI